MKTEFENVRKSETYDKWLDKLSDRNAKLRIVARVKRLLEGTPGDGRHFGGGISELKIDYGPGYRVYYTIRGNIVYVLLCGGDKSNQQADIIKARKLLEHVEEML